MWILIIPAIAIIGAWAYGAQKVATKAPPIPQDPEPPVNLFAQLAAIKPGDILTVDVAKFLEAHDMDPALFAGIGLTKWEAASTLNPTTGIVRAVSLDPRITHNPITGIGTGPAPIPANAITEVQITAK